MKLTAAEGCPFFIASEAKREWKRGSNFAKSHEKSFATSGSQIATVSKSDGES